jgi:hypothetical protein
MRNFIFIAAAAGLLAGCAHDQRRTAEAKADRPYCLQDTGSRIPTKPGDCNNQPGRSISREEMERTGAFTTFDAIRRIEPSAH